MERSGLIAYVDKEKAEYRQFYNRHQDICVFSSPWWLDAVSADDWEVILVKENSTIVASFPYAIKKQKFKRIDITMPPLTQKLGPYIVYGNRKNEIKKREFENSVFDAIIGALPRYNRFFISFDQKYDNWLAFYWKGFSQSSRYSYKIFQIGDLERVLRGFSYSKRSLIKHAEMLHIEEDVSKKDYYDFFLSAIKERSERVSFSYETFSRIYDSAYSNNQGKAYACKDAKGEVHAEAFFVWDKENAYYLSAMRKKDYISSGATELLVYEFMKRIGQTVDNFDFEGSMIEGVEASYRRYGAVQTQYFTLTKNNNIMHRIINHINEKLF